MPSPFRRSGSKPRPKPVLTPLQAESAQAAHMVMSFWTSHTFTAAAANQREETLRKAALRHFKKVRQGNEDDELDTDAEPGAGPEYQDNSNNQRVLNWLRDVDEGAHPPHDQADDLRQESAHPCFAPSVMSGLSRLASRSPTQAMGTELAFKPAAKNTFEDILGEGPGAAMVERRAKAVRKALADDNAVFVIAPDTESEQSDSPNDEDKKTQGRDIADEVVQKQKGRKSKFKEHLSASTINAASKRH